MPMNSCFLNVILLGLVVSSSCGWNAPAECKSFYALNAKQQEAAFKSFPVQKQLEIYRCGMRREPPDMGLSLYIADGGEQNIPFLLATLKDEKSEAMQSHLIDVFEAMSRRGYLHGRRDVVDQIKQVVSNMKDSFWKQVSQKSLENIEKAS